MKAYIYRADLHCEVCGRQIIDRLTTEGQAPEDPMDERTWDSEDFPKGPYPDGGGEGDSPGYCGTCGIFLENPLTREGYHHVYEHIIEALAGELSLDSFRLARARARSYDVELSDLFRHAEPEGTFPVILLKA